MSNPGLSSGTIPGLSDFVDYVRLEAARSLDPTRRAALGQFFTPTSVAKLMASLSNLKCERVRLLDAGAGVGVLSAAWVAHACESASPPERIDIVAYELDAALVPALIRVLEHAREYGREHGVTVDFQVRGEDFIREAVRSLNGGLFGASWPEFDAAILNPPYKKFRTDSPERRLLRDVGVETSNLYTAFVALAVRGLKHGGELVAITPRSFCNGPYFTPFRRDLLRLGNLTHLHVFDSRDGAFGDDEVLQENVVFRVERGTAQCPAVSVEWSAASESHHTVRRTVPFGEVVRPGDRDAFIHIAPDEWDARVAGLVRGLTGSLQGLGVEVSTGRVVDFRAREYLRSHPETGTTPLIYPTHFNAGRIQWPKADSKKPNALIRAAHTENQLNPTGTYVLVKRFSAKEERRRVVAAVFTPDAAPGEFVAFENHLNYFHRRGHGIPRKLAEGLAAFLNSTVLDLYFRQFNGHTQVNATDLRKLCYPSAEQLERLAALAAEITEQSKLDDIVEEELFDLPKSTRGGRAVKARIGEASSILKSLGLPREQTNERAALTFLALLDLKPDQPWTAASTPLCGVTPIMEFAAENYGKQWKPNTRETVRRFTLHQFRDAGLVVLNPDRPDRPVNSPDYCYQVPDEALRLLRTYGSAKWEGQLRQYLASGATLAAKYASAI